MAASRPPPAVRGVEGSGTSDGGQGSANSPHCDLCGELIVGPPGGSGLFVWTRGTEVRYDEPPLCEDCARRLTVGALAKWSLEDEDDG